MIRIKEYPLLLMKRLHQRITQIMKLPTDLIPTPFSADGLFYQESLLPVPPQIVRCFPPRSLFWTSFHELNSTQRYQTLARYPLHLTQYLNPTLILPKGQHRLYAILLSCTQQLRCTTRHLQYPHQMDLV